MKAEIVEVAPRDGFQPIGPFIPTECKLAMIAAAHAAGLRRVEIGAFVSPKAVPQMRDAAELLAGAARLPGLDAQVLVPNARGVALALEAGARHLVYVLSVSEAHNRSNVRRSVAESAAEYGSIVADLPHGIGLRLNLATAFDCPFDGRVASTAVLALLDRLLLVRANVEVGLCDTTGRADPIQVETLFKEARARFPEAGTTWAFHGHDTYGLGLANVAAAWRADVRVFDAAFGGLGGCPFAPGATGNVATEDVIWMFSRMGVDTGVQIEPLLDLAVAGAMLPGASPGGRVRDALRGRRN